MMNKPEANGETEKDMELGPTTFCTDGLQGIQQHKSRMEGLKKGLT